MIDTTSPLEENKVKVMDSIYASESLIEVIFNSLAMPFSSNPPQPSIDAMLENSDMGATMREGFNMAARLLRGLLPLMERQLSD